MPELPEVEIIKRGLAKKIVGKTIEKFDFNPPKIFKGTQKDLINKRIISVSRRAKIIIITLNDQTKVTIHLKMTGQLIFDSREGLGKNPQKRIAGGHPSKDLIAELPNKHTRAIFHFKGGGVLYFNDQRKFGYIKIYKNDIPELKKIGIEGLSDDLNAKYLQQKGKSRSIAVKKFLMDQSVIAGIGNIYSDEALFCARISPQRKTNDVSNGEFKKIVSCIKEVLNKGIRYGGSSSRNYVNSSGGKGKMQNYFTVYGREDEDCPICRGKIKRIKIGGRSAHYCPKCQK